MIDLEFPDEPGYSPEGVEGLLSGRLIDCSMLGTMNDVKLLQLGWVYDVNFAATLKRIRQRRFLERMIDFLPETSDIEEVKKKVFGYVDFRIKK